MRLPNKSWVELVEGKCATKAEESGNHETKPRLPNKSWEEFVEDTKAEESGTILLEQKLKSLERYFWNKKQGGACKGGVHNKS